MWLKKEKWCYFKCLSYKSLLQWNSNNVKNIREFSAKLSQIKLSYSGFLKVSVASVFKVADSRHFQSKNLCSPLWPHWTLWHRQQHRIFRRLGSIHLLFTFIDEAWLFHPKCFHSPLAFSCYYLSVRFGIKDCDKTLTSCLFTLLNFFDEHVFSMNVKFGQAFTEKLDKAGWGKQLLKAIA